MSCVATMFLALVLWPTAALGLYIAIATVWSILFHPLRHISGPKAWAAFPLLRYISATRGNLEEDLRQLHSVYGPAVRFGPDEVSFITAEAWKDIYGHGQPQLPKVLNSASDPNDIISSNHDDHSRFRRAMSHAFSAKGLQSQEPLLISYVDKLIERLKSNVESGVPADMVKWYNLTTFDIIGDLAFGKPFGGLDSSEYHHWVATIFGSVKALSFVKLKDTYPTVFRFLQALLFKNASSVMEARIKQLEHSAIAVQNRLRNADSAAYSNRVDFMDSMLRHRGEKNELTDRELEANSSILIIAGSETTATLLSGATYWILRNPNVAARVTAEVRSVMKNQSDITFQKVTAELPYMQACLDEALRMYPPVPSGQQRWTVVPTTISGYDIPAGVKVSVHQFAAYHSPTNFYLPHSFIPDRWLPSATKNPSSPFYSDKREVFQPFSVGPRNCIGRNLAYAEMRVIFARVLWNFDLELCEESARWDEQNSYILWEKSPLMCRLKVRGGL
ncbi:cytochrome P450 [Aspergillus stella-maris]|uniref:cytochrome P450 n=1 Tax=Aspergillus stella-maris TaxID=1810926 RepID=UPI003CCD4286